MTRAYLVKTFLVATALTTAGVVRPGSAAEHSTFFENGLGTVSPAPSDKHQSAFERGEAEMSHRDFEGAVSAFSEAIGFNMNNADAYFKRGQCYYYQKNYQSALSDFEYMLKMTPNATQALLWSGTAHARMGHEERAVDFYLRAMRTDPKLVSQFQQGTQGAAQTHSVNPKNEGAVNAYAKAVALYLGDAKPTESTEAPNSITAGKKSDASLFAVEPTIVDNGKAVVSEAPEWQKDSSIVEPYFKLEELDAAIKSSPADAASYFRRGVYNKHSGHKEKALSDFSEAIRLDPTISRFYLARARLYHEQNQPELSLADVKKAQSLDATVPQSIDFDEGKTH